MEALPAIKADEDEEADEDAEESDTVVSAPSDARVQSLDVLMAASRNWARGLAQVRRTPGESLREAIGVVAQDISLFHRSV
jgi:hypothetical protein